jgi:hypothetical protein
VALADAERPDPFQTDRQAEAEVLLCRIREQFTEIDNFLTKYAPSSAVGFHPPPVPQEALERLRLIAAAVSVAADHTRPI